MATEDSVDAEVKTPWGSVGGKNLTINTLLTLAILIIVTLTGWNLWQHQQDAKDASTAFIGALKEQTQAMKEGTAVSREQNCLLKFDPKDRMASADWCKQISGVSGVR